MSAQRGNFINWSLFAILSIVWGSSFILMKVSLRTLVPYQVASVRMISGCLVLLPIAVSQFKKIPAGKLGFVILSGFLGSFIPSFLFCYAISHIDSSLAGFLNTLTPIITITTGVIIFHTTIPRNKIIGITVGFVGMLILFFSKGTADLKNIGFSFFVLLAVISYAININMVNRHLHDISSTNIAAVSFVPIMIPSLIILWVSGYFNLPLTQTETLLATGAAAFLGIMSTAIASILFYVLLKRAGAIFASTVTYGIPFIALFWGILDGELINTWQLLGLMIILGGVYLTNRSRRSEA